MFELDVPPKASSFLSDIVLPGLPSSALMIRHSLQSYGCGGVIDSVLIRHFSNDEWLVARHAFVVARSCGFVTHGTQLTAHLSSVCFHRQSHLILTSLADAIQQQEAAFWSFFCGLDEIIVGLIALIFSFLAPAGVA